MTERPARPAIGPPVARRRFLGLLTAASAGTAAALTGCVGRKAPGFEGIGVLTVAVPPDFSLGGQRKRSIERWWKDGGWRVNLVELPSAADGQHSQLMSELQAGSGRYDVIGLDVTWTATFAKAGYILPLTSVRDELGLDRFLPAALKTGWIDGELWAVPLHTNVGILYYRTDLVTSPPTDWRTIADQARRLAHGDLAGYVGQFNDYEGLTVNLSEVVWGHGGTLVEGGDVLADRPEAMAGYALLRDGLRDGWIPREALGYDEERSRKRFQDGKAAFLRNWPYAFAQLSDSKDSAVAGRFDVAPLPGANALGGMNLAVTTSCKHRETALRFIQYLTGEDVQREGFPAGGYPPVIASAYADPGHGDPRYRRLVEVMDQSNRSARPRPVSAYYQRVSAAIQGVVHPALTDGLNEKDTMRLLASRLGDALRGH
jgi:multiple sugar transport system substrate-binding protein